LADYPVRGIDVSRHNGDIDWAKVKASGISFAYIKATQGEGGTDPRLQEYVANLHTAGMPFGVYAMYDPCADPDKQAEHLMKTVPAGTDVLPVVLDVELISNAFSSMRCFDSENPTISLEKISRVLQRLTSAYGKPPVLYFLPSMQKYFSDERFGSYPLWVADYRNSSVSTGSPQVPRWTIWQYSNQGRVDGIGAGVDLNLFAGSPRDFEAFKSGRPPDLKR
jgi:lysozyme